MSFQPISKKKLCKDFRRAIWSEGCKYSDECKKEGYILLPNSNLCSGVEMPISPEPTAHPLKPERMDYLEKGANYW